jgi:hypothetical protein
MIAANCLLALSTAMFASQCHPFMASGTYLTTLNGWATLAVMNQVPVVAPVAGLGKGALDESGAFSLPFDWTLAGQHRSGTITGNITVNRDCTVAFKVDCGEACVWEGSGFYLLRDREMHLLVTKTNDYPLTTVVVLRRVEN